MRRPITSTYRLQLRGPGADPAGRAFGFAEAQAQIPYLRDLGVSHLYLSPIFTAMPESNHGYDVLDPTEVNPELGGIEGLRELARAAHDAGLGIVLDIVPNHVGVEVPHRNRWWWDVLKLGADSEFATYFDIDWHEDNGAGGKLGLPVLGKEGDEEQLRLTHLAEDEFPAGTAPGGEDVLAYYDNYFPLAPGSYGGLDDDPLEVYQRQPYKLMYWRDGVISYRRFFSVDGLAGVRQEDPLVFEHTHRLLRQLIAEELIDGVRVDHPDGLTNPFAYLSRLRDLVGHDRWLVVEKILGVNEPLDPRLHVDGTTGYDALRELDGIFLNRSAEDTLSMLALQQSGSTWDEEAIAASEQQLKHDVASSELGAEVRRLVRAIRRDNFSAVTAEVSDEQLASTVIELVAAMPVYRADYRSLSRITSSVISDMAKRFPSRRNALDLIAAAFLASGEAKNRFAQVCGAVMAKGVEDTLFYRASRLVALQEVGGAPGRFGVGAAEFHLLQDERAGLWPHAMTSLSTHDTKRSEDTRARIIELTEVPNDFAELVRQVVALVPPPDSATGHFLLQNIIGVWPEDGAVTDALRERLHGYATKAVREAALHTTWVDPDARYEQRVLDWVDAVLYGPAAARVSAFVRQLHIGAVQVSLGRKLLQLVGPGIPDTYQGQEFVELALVDPDNRAFVDYTARAQTLAQYDAARDGESFDIASFLYDEVPPTPEALAERGNRAKQAVTAEALRLRRQRPEVFTEGSYRAVFALGPAQHHLVGMARGMQGEDAQVIGLATREPLKLARTGGWGETTVDLPEGTWVERLSRREFRGTVQVADVFSALPVALFVRAGA
ncbi:malto-oligosyltrehalose synthase [Corynebacterium gottingense]|uniref:Malto-oligosyltrehalose synthase n=1 Tax=Corynebacterium gottingense TaxID=2041036 RepID=A0ABX9UIB1_9CORY|nr:malto-oligosyltrehalose synthase [Corynebacterium gottingense]RMD18623.1 malto-oligosyltrehalose synthase [Corynebacterium gottingense]WJZ13457.1 Maltooligosyl trehalose synthase [Corynebacterium gottingense]WJZ15775.1 Maltooligosyl trehalose synthase [Corynebacterium gottingense]